MAKRKESVDVVEETTEVSEQSRRDFITKMVVAAGAVAAAGLVAGPQSADAAGDIKIDDVKGEIHKDVTQIKWGKIRNGFRLSLSGRQLGTALQGAGVLAQGANLENATLTIEFSA
jgi:hypothetical protein